MTSIKKIESDYPGNIEVEWEDGRALALRDYPIQLPSTELILKLAFKKCDARITWRLLVIRDPLSRFKGPSEHPRR